MSDTLVDAIKRWTAKRKSALVIEIIQGKTTVAEVSRMYDLAPSEVESCGLRLMRRKGRQAVVAVARKLAVIMHRMWADNTEFRHRPLEGAMT